MERQIQINWDNFERRFNGKEQSAFEQFAYCLFCYEHDIKKGLFRYKNQTGIETDPVERNGEVIGFQAKYFDRAARLSSKKSVLIDSIKDAKRKNTKLTKIIFYLNQEFGESKEKNKKDPKYKIEIELAGKQEGVEVEWRVKSHFEVQMISMADTFIAEYYFGNENSVWDFAENMEKHTEYLVNKVKDHICYENTEIYFHRPEYDHFLNTVYSEKSCLIISGPGGLGKTAFIKKWYYEQSPLLFMWRMSEFGIANIQDLFKNYGSYTVYDFVQVFHSETGKKYIVLDSAEDLYEMPDLQPLSEFLSIMAEYGWTLVFTIRTAFVESLKKVLYDIGLKELEIIEVNLISKAELQKTAQDFKVLLPDHKRIYELLRIPFYLNEYLQSYSVELRTAVTVSHFMDRLWRKKVLGEPIRANRMHIRRKNIMYGIVKYKAEHSCFFIREHELPDYDQEALQCLINDEVIDEDARQRCFIAHDVYEEWAWLHYIEEIFTDYQYDVEEFFEHLSESVSCRRSLRQWLIYNFADDRQELSEFVRTGIESQAVDAKWKDDICIAILESDDSSRFLNKEKAYIIENNCRFLCRIIFLLRTAVKKPMGELQFMIPDGQGWSAVIQFIGENYDDIFSTNVDRKEILGLLNDWTSIFHKGKVAKTAAKIACRMYDDEKYLYDLEHELIAVILDASVEIKPEFIEMFRQEKNNRYGGRYRRIFSSFLNSLKGIIFKLQYAAETAEIAEYYWFNQEERYESSNDWEDMFGINRSYSHVYHPVSAYRTPVYWMLQGEEERTFDFIIQLVNRTIEHYVKYTSKRKQCDFERIVITIDGMSKEQYVNDRIWQMYRGTQTGPDLLKCILAALEKYLLEKGKKWSSEELFSKLKYLTLHSESAAVTAVAVSIIAAYPYKLYKLALDFLKTPEIIRYDRIRQYFEKNLQNIVAINALSRTRIAQICVEERKKTLGDVFRNKLFEHLILEYQLNENAQDLVRSSIWEILDQKFKEFDGHKEEDRISLYQLYYTGMDIRKNDFEEFTEKGMHGIRLKPKLDNRQREMQQKYQMDAKFRQEKMRLFLWTHQRFEETEQEYVKYSDYEENPQKAYEEMLGFPEFADNFPEYEGIIQNLPPYICAVLIRDFPDRLKKEQLKECILFIIKVAADMLNEPGQVYADGTGKDAIVRSLVLLLDNNEYSETVRKILVMLLIMEEFELQIMVAKELQKSSDKYVRYFSLVLAKYHDAYLNQIKYSYAKDRNHLIEKFWVEHEKEIFSVSEEDSVLSEEVFQVSSVTTIRLIMKIAIHRDDAVCDYALKKFIQIYMVSDENWDKKDFETIWDIFEMFAKVLFLYQEDRVRELISAFIPALRKDQWLQRFLLFVIMEADQTQNKERFWIIWKGLYDFIVSAARTEEEHQIHHSGWYDAGAEALEYAIIEYLFASPQTWKKDVHKWDILSEDCEEFLNNCYHALGFHRAALYSVSYFITHIGSELFFDMGITWIYNIIIDNEHLANSKLIENTCYYLESIMRQYSKRHMEDLKKNPSVRKKVTKILDFMIEHGSADAFTLRQEIL